MLMWDDVQVGMLAAMHMYCLWSPEVSVGVGGIEVFVSL
jgi:hypothetical protein